jgi:hypothetical protein
VHWERIETGGRVLRRPRSANSTCVRPTSRRASDWTGWHAIEKDLWPPADRLHSIDPRARGASPTSSSADTDGPRTRDARDLTFTPDQLGNGAKELLDEVATGKVTGEEEIWSHTDLWDFQANVDGARVAFENSSRCCETKDPDLADAARRCASRPAGRCSTSSASATASSSTPTSHEAGQGTVRRRQRPQRAAVEADRGGAPDELSAGGAVLGLFGAGAALSSVAGTAAGRGHAAPPAAAAAWGLRRRAQCRYPFHGEHQAAS